MPRKINLNILYQAAHLDFLGVQKSKIASDLNVSLGTLTNWAKRQEWIEFQNELAEKRREQLLNALDATPHMEEYARFSA